MENDIGGSVDQDHWLNKYITKCNGPDISSNIYLVGEERKVSWKLDSYPNCVATVYCHK